MSKQMQDLVVAKKCSHCKLKDTNKCEGQYIKSYMILQVCPSFIDSRADKIIQNDIYIPYPTKIKKARKK